jgi:hypothetical protein
VRLGTPCSLETDRNVRHCVRESGKREKGDGFIFFEEALERNPNLLYYTRDWIAARLNVSSRQVQAAMDYIRDHETQASSTFPIYFL